MAHAVVSLLHQNYQMGDTIELRDVRQNLIERFGDQGTVRASASSILRTFAHFGVFAVPTRAGEYAYRGRLAVGVEVFPLLIWAWWSARRKTVIRIPELADDPLLTFVDPASYAAHWVEYEGALWALETRNGIDCAILKHRDNAAFIRTLFNLLSAHPKWPKVNRQFPEP